MNLRLRAFCSQNHFHFIVSPSSSPNSEMFSGFRELKKLDHRCILAIMEEYDATEHLKATDYVAMREAQVEKGLIGKAIVQREMPDGTTRVSTYYLPKVSLLEHIKAPASDSDAKI